MATSTHLGKKISRLRELRGLKQETLAEKLGISQQSVSKIEQNETIEDVMLERVANALGVTPEVIKNFSEEATIYNIQNNYEGSNPNATNVAASSSRDFNKCTFNSFDKWAEALEENKKLYEALLKEKDEKVALQKKVIDKLESLLKKKK